jgi:hypothetical protein
MATVSRLLHGTLVTIGRAPSADVVIDADLLVSRLRSTLKSWPVHARLSITGCPATGRSSNGRRVSGRVQSHDRDEIRVGFTVLTFCGPTEVDGVHTLVGEPLPVASRLTPVQRAVLLARCRQ